MVPEPNPEVVAAREKCRHDGTVTDAFNSVAVACARHTNKHQYSMLLNSMLVTVYATPFHMGSSMSNRASDNTLILQTHFLT